MPDTGDDIYDFSDEPPARPASARATPAQPTHADSSPTLTPATTLAYENPTTAKHVAARLGEIDSPAGLRLAVILVVVGVAMVFVPFYWELGFSLGVTLYLSAYLLVRFAMALVATLILAYGLSISFGDTRAYLIRLLSLVTMTEGVMFTVAVVIGSCIGFPAGILSSLAVCWYLFTKLFELEAPENLFAAIAYWLPGLCGIFLILRLTDWLVGLVT